MTDEQVVTALGGPPGLAPILGVSLDAARKFAKRGIPWKYRAKIRRLAQSRKIKLPPDFLDTQRAA